jgi:hypothetical protein
MAKHRGAENSLYHVGRPPSKLQIRAAYDVHTNSKIQEVIIIIPALSPTDDNLFLLLVLCHGVQHLLQLALSHFLS